MLGLRSESTWDLSSRSGPNPSYFSSSDLPKLCERIRSLGGAVYRLLRARCERPRYRAADRANEFPPPDVDCHATLRWGHAHATERDSTTPLSRGLRPLLKLGEQPINGIIFLRNLRTSDYHRVGSY
jgi:hypothetical protein